MEYIHFNQNYEEDVVDLWNRCCFYDHITVERFRNQALFDDNFDASLTFMAMDKDKLVGFIMATKRKFPYMEKGLEPDRGWINVIFVDEDYQNKGIGSQLYFCAEEELKKRGVTEITLALYSPHYFFAGIDENNYYKSASFFKKHGYTSTALHYSMGRSLFGFSMSEVNLSKKEKLEREGYSFQCFTYRYSLELLAFLKDEFGGGWKRNALMAMRNGTAEDVILIVLDKNEKICGFSMSAIDGNPMRFGPIGVAKNERNSGIGSVLLDYSLEHMENRGIHYMFFMTTDEPGKRYYERNGLSVIRTFSEYRKKI